METLTEATATPGDAPSVRLFARHLAGDVQRRRPQSEQLTGRVKPTASATWRMQWEWVIAGSPKGAPQLPLPERLVPLGDVSLSIVDRCPMMPETAATEHQGQQ